LNHEKCKNNTQQNTREKKKSTNCFSDQMTSFDRFPDALTHRSGQEYVFASTVVVDGITYRLYGQDKDIGMHFASIYCQETSIWICSMDSMIINVFGDMKRATLSQIVLKSDSSLEALFFVHNSESPQDGDSKYMCVHFTVVYILTRMFSIFSSVGRSPRTE
jgi:hypothetical protein